MRTRPSSTALIAGLSSTQLASLTTSAIAVLSTAQLAASAPMPLTSKQKPETVARLPIRQWARNLGLPGNPTGPIRATVQAAYDAAQNGATDAEAVELYHQLEQERLTANSKAKQAKWAGGAGTARQAELAPIRQWAAANGIAVAKNARIPQEVLDAYAAAQAGTTRKRRPSKLNKTPKPPKDAP